MAQILDRTQRADLARFVDALYELGGYKTNTQWGDESRVPRNNIGKIRNAQSGVDGYNLLKLIRAVADRLGVDPASAAVTAALRQPSEVGGSQIEELERRIESRLEEVSAVTADNFRLVLEALDDVARRLPGEEPPAQEEQNP